jgi:hypothetical protein
LVARVRRDDHATLTVRKKLASVDLERLAETLRRDPVVGCHVRAVDDASSDHGLPILVHDQDFQWFAW